MGSSETTSDKVAPLTPSRKRLTVYFDGSCPLCTAEIRHYAARDEDGVLCLVDVSQKPANIGPGLDREAAMRRFHVRQSDGTLLSGAAAFAAVWAVTPGWRLLGRIASARPVAILLEAGYRTFLPVRPMISRMARVIFARPEDTR